MKSFDLEKKRKNVLFSVMVNAFQLIQTRRLHLEKDIKSPPDIWLTV
jgi:hypothetical protein